MIESSNVKIQIKQEQLDIAKEWIQTGEVKIYRETLMENKTFNVPVKREELVIEKKTIASVKIGHKDSLTEVIRIPISEEQVEFTKHMVTLEDISIYKEQIEDIKHIEDTLKKESAKIKITGSPKVRYE